ncbi:MFS transporter [Streptomyces sp. ISL-11]|uniref:MFS transporter n=1 Tax=Streptomyces sp. ISL-11 TaxID=2819174 RepID=UPI001BE9B0AF|nr:MFS transporter [Streptomyces sp. ISL-11]MBT2383350.1 MFS transporter [Streptomyces sp. ISL-11]
MTTDGALSSERAPDVGTASLSGPSSRGARNTYVLVAFTALTNLADGVTKVVLPLLATRVTDSPLQVSGVAVTLTLPWLLVSLYVGVLVDRFDRRRLLWLADGVRTASVLVLLAAMAADGISIPLLYGCGLVLGVAEVVALTAATSLVPTAVPEEGRERANAWVAGAETVCNEFAGPLVGGLLLAAGAALALGTTGAAYAAGALMLVLLIGRFRPSAPETPRASVHQEIRQGLTFLWRQPILRFMALALTVLCACWGAWLALIPLAATKLMGASSGEYGLLLSALGLGGVAGALLVGRINRLLGRRWALFADILGTFAMVAVPVVTTSVPLVAVAAFAGGMGGVLWTVNSRTISQSLVPDALLGRYNAAARLFSWGAMPVGSALAGVLAQWFGMRATFAVFAVITAAIVLPFFRYLPTRSLHPDRPATENRRA